jgi:hypothetical protein
MKKTLITTSIAVAAAAFGLSSYGAPLLALDEDTELFVLGSAGIEYESNLYTDRVNRVSDFRFTASPGVEIAHGRTPAANASVTYRHHFHFYDSESTRDGNYADLSAQARYDTGVTISNIQASFRQRVSNDADVNLVGRLVKRDETRLNGSSRYQISELMGISAGLEYADTSFKDPALTSFDYYAIPLTYYYKVRPQLDLTAGYRYRNTSVSGPTGDSKDNYFFVGAQGELGSPMFIGNLSLGYQERKFSGINDKRSSPSYSFMVSYLATPRITHFANLAYDFRTSSSQGLSYSYGSLTIGTRARITDMIATNFSLTYAEAEYQRSPRAEDHMFFNAGVTYNPNDYVTVRADYAYQSVDGKNTAGASDYRNNRLSVSASVRY